MTTYFWVALGSALGGMARHWSGAAAAAAFGTAFPWGTLLVNVAGSLVIGLFAALASAGGRIAIPSDAQAFVMAGLCGGYTTFSAFSLQTFALLRDGAWLRAGGNVLLSVVLCLAAVWLGHRIGLLLGNARIG